MCLAAVDVVRALIRTTTHSTAARKSVSGAEQVQELCEAANKEVGPQEGVRIANFLCNGNYAVSGGLPGCEASPVLLQVPLKAC